MFWYLKQLFPLPYRSVYLASDGWHDSRWWMWLGRCFAKRDRRLPLPTCEGQAHGWPEWE